MNSNLLRELLNQEEGLKLDFKQNFYNLSRDENSDKNSRERQTDEFIKDVLALTNGNTGTANESAYLIIGVGDSLNEYGTRDLYNIDGNKIKSKDIIEILNAGIYPPLPDVKFHNVKLSDTNIVAIEIPPSPHLHETRRHLKTAKSEFHPGTVLVRRSEGIYPSLETERYAIRKEKEIFSQTQKESLVDINDVTSLNKEDVEYNTRKNRFFSKNTNNNSSSAKKIVHWSESIIHWLNSNDIINVNSSLFGEVYIDLEQFLVNAAKAKNINNDIKSRIYYMLAKIEIFLSHDAGEAFILCKKSIRYRRDYGESLLFGVEICKDLLSYDNIYKEDAQTHLIEWRSFLDQLESSRKFSQ